MEAVRACPGPGRTWVGANDGDDVGVVEGSLVGVVDGARDGAAVGTWKARKAKDGWLMIGGGQALDVAMGLVARTMEAVRACPGPRRTWVGMAEGAPVGCAVGPVGACVGENVGGGVGQIVSLLNRRLNALEVSGSLDVSVNGGALMVP